MINRTIGDVCSINIALGGRCSEQLSRLFIAGLDQIERSLAVFILYPATRLSGMFSRMRNITYLVSAPASNKLSTMCALSSSLSILAAKWRGVSLSVRLMGSTSHSSCDNMSSRTSVDPCATLGYNVLSQRDSRNIEGENVRIMQSFRDQKR